jgi:hypothetical protein
MPRWVSAGRLFACALSISAVATHLAAEAAEEVSEISGWTGLAQFAAGYDTNANASTREQEFLGFTLDPRFVESESSFGELTLGLNHTAVLASDRGFNSSLQVAHRANPHAPFANQTVAFLGTEAVLLRDAGRFTLGISAYADRLDGKNNEHGTSIDLGMSRQSGENLEMTLSMRASRIGYEESDLEQLDVDRYLGGVSLTRHNLGTQSGSVGFTLLAGRDVARRLGSPFGNNRMGIQLSTSWAVLPQASLYVELSGMRSDFTGEFFALDRKDDQYEATMALEFSDWPAARWSVMPQVRHVRNDSTLSLFKYDRIEAALYVRRQF